MSFIFTVFVIYPMTISAQDSLSDQDIVDALTDDAVEAQQPNREPSSIPKGDLVESTFFDALPIEQSEVNTVTNLFWNAQSIQDTVKSNLPENLKTRFARGASACDVKGVTKTEGSAEVCEMAEDPERMAKFIYNFNVSCSFGSYQISVCSREERKLMNQLKVNSPEKLVSDKIPALPEST